jgi:hypothetical protein
MSAGKDQGKEDEERRNTKMAYHWFYVRMWNSIELVELEFELWADVDICTLVFGCIAIFGCGED